MSNKPITVADTQAHTAIVLKTLLWAGTDYIKVVNLVKEYTGWGPEESRGWVDLMRTRMAAWAKARGEI